MADDLFDLLEGLEALDRKPKEVVRAPFPYVGSKSRSVAEIVKHLPHRKIYVEPFCGTAIVLLNRAPAKMEVINDMDSGIVCFYRCLRDDTKRQHLVDLIKASVHSREDWVDFKRDWQTEPDEVERAFKWLYVITYSFSGLGRNYGRALKPGMFSGKLWNKIPEFQPIAERLRNVQIEHMDGLACIEQYDSLDTLFYIDPPYIEGDQSCYKARFDRSQHVELINAIKRCKGAVALSGYDNELYNQVDWHDTFEFTVFQSIHGEGTGTKSHLAGAPKTAHGKEKLWLKV